MTMPRKRTPAALRETPEARALRAAVLEELRTPLGPERPKTARKARKWAARVIERGGDLPAALAELDREGLLHPEPVAADAYPAHREAAARIVAPGAVRPAPAPKAEPVTDELAEKRKARRTRPAGLAGYVRVTDDDDFDDWD
jgi:hypothetical protein